jgi:tellurite resistance protein
MAIDINVLKEKASSLLGEAGRKIRQYTPETFSPEKKYINAMVSAIALMVLADKKIETEEVVQSIEFISSLDEVRELEMSNDAIEMYEHILEEMAPHFDNPVKWITSVAKILGNISLVKDNPAYKDSIIAVLDHIAGSDGNVDPSELEMKEKIIQALS